MSSIKVIGHCPPDTDSTCSPIVYAWFLKNNSGMDAQAVVCGKLNKEAAFVLNYFKVEAPKLIESVSSEDKLVLIDTNNPEELVKGWETSEIIEIVDHHKLYGLKTNNIAKVTVRTYGCVATVIWELMGGESATLTKEMAGLMASCIISDTLNLTSPTVTETDKIALTHLSKIAQIDVNTYAKQMFDAKSNLDGMSAKEIVTSDAKNFDFGGKTYKLGVLETTSPSQSLGKLSELKSEMNNIISEEKLSGFMFFVVDILKGSASLVTANKTDTDLSEKAFGVTPNSEGILELPGVVSRKKQMVPSIEKAVLS